MDVSPAEGRRIAVRAQLLDGSATDVLSTVHQLGFLQIDPISTVAPPQYLVLWSRLGRYDRAELDRLLWEEKKLFEWNAFIWPIEDLPLLQARMRAPWGSQKSRQWAKQFMKEQAGLRKYVLRELEQRGPLLSRELEHHAARANERYVWWGTRAHLMWMLELLHTRGRVAVAGRRSGQRLWDLAERWYPETDRVPLAEARRLLDEKRFRALGVRREKGRLIAHPEAVDGRIGTRVTFLSPFDRLIHDRARTTELFGFEYVLEMYKPAAKRRWGYFALPILHHDRLVGKLDATADRKASVLRVNAIHEDVKFTRPIAKGVHAELEDLAAWLGLDTIAD